MPRPIRHRVVSSQPDVVYFKPAGVPMRSLEEIILKVEEIEALKLCDAEEKGQKEAAKIMKISQPTFNRVLSSARKKIATAVSQGKAIKIEGGNFQMK